MTTLREAARSVLDRWDSSEYAASDLFEDLRAALEQPKREPLTEDEIRRMKPISPDLVDFRSGVRCAEAAHGIKGEA